MSCAAHSAIICTWWALMLCSITSIQSRLSLRTPLNQLAAAVVTKYLDPMPTAAPACLVPQGLIMYNATSKEVVLLTHRVSSTSPLQPDTPITYANDLDIAKDGTIYFTDSVNITSHRWAGMPPRSAAVYLPLVLSCSASKIV